MIRMMVKNKKDGWDWECVGHVVVCMIGRGTELVAEECAPFLFQDVLQRHMGQSSMCL